MRKFVSIGFAAFLALSPGRPAAAQNPDPRQTDPIASSTSSKSVLTDGTPIRLRTSRTYPPVMPGPETW
jgi:hypothetical protein